MHRGCASIKFVRNRGDCFPMGVIVVSGDERFAVFSRAACNLSLAIWV